MSIRIKPIEEAKERIMQRRIATEKTNNRTDLYILNCIKAIEEYIRKNRGQEAGFF